MQRAYLGTPGFWVLCGLTVGVKLFLLQREVTVLTMRLHRHGIRWYSVFVVGVDDVVTDILFAPTCRIVRMGAWFVNLR
jgi:hypothetical protein